jgi:hypothetical protein
MWTTPTLLPFVLVLALSSCSGSMDVRACLLNDRLAFELGDVPRFPFGKERPAPHHVFVQIPSDPALKDEKAWEQRLMWEASYFANAKPDAQERSIIVYGQELAGFSVTQTPRLLRRGTAYRVRVSGGPFVGGTVFIYSPKLPACTQKNA